jgi:hypothetical protein
MTSVTMTSAIQNCWEVRSTGHKTPADHCLTIGGALLATRRPSRCSTAFRPARPALIL